MTDLTNKLVSNTYKQLILVSSAVSNTGVDTSLKPVQTGDGTNTALQVAVSAIKVTGDAAVSGNVSVRGNLHADDRVCASAFYGDGSNITGVTATIAGNISVSNAVVGGTLQVSGTTTIVGATHLKAAVSVGGAAQFGSTVTVSGAAQFNSTVTAVGAATFKSTVTVENALAAKNNVTVGGTFNVAGAGTFTSKTEFKNDVSVSGRLDVATSASVGGTFRATGNAGFSGAVSVSGGLVVGDTVTILGTNLQAANARVCASAFYGEGSNLTNLAASEISGNISVNAFVAGGNASIAGNLTAVGTQVKFENAAVCASTYYGDGSNLTGITAELITDGRVGGSLAVSAALSVGSTLDVGGNVSIGGTTDFSGNISLGDNVKANFGDSDDLQIYHDGGNSVIRDTGTGGLFLMGSSNVYITNNGASANFFAATEGAEVTLFYNNSAKLATTNTGIDVTGTITFDGGTTSADLNFGDDDKAIFGTGSDLQIYHDGSNSYVRDVGTGNLNISGEEVRILNSGNSELKALFTTDGSVELYYDNSKTFETASGGISVTGNVGSSGYLNFTSASSFIGAGNNAIQRDAAGGLVLTGQGSTSDFTFINDLGTTWLSVASGTTTATFAGDVDIQSSTGGKLILTTTDTSGATGEDVGSIDFYSSDASTGSTGVQARILGEMDSNGDSTALQFFTGLSTGSGSPTLRKRIQIDGATATNGNISFYEDTGTTAKFYWDAHNERLGLGTSSPATQFENLTASGTLQTRTKVTGSTASDIAELGISTGTRTYLIQSKGSTGDFVIRDSTGAADRITMDTSGRLLLGATGVTYADADADNLLIGDGSTANRGLTIATSNTNTATIAFSDGTGASQQKNGSIVYDHSNASMQFTSNNSERMRIDSSGHVLIGKTSADGTVNGVQLLSDGRTGITSTSDYQLYLNRKTSDGDMILFNKDGTEVGAIQSSSGGLTITSGSGGTAALTIDSSQNVGIGSSPAFSTGSGLEIERAGTSTIRLQNTSTSKSAELNMATDFEFVTINSASDFVFKPAAGSEVMRIDTTGVGLSTSAPKEKLDSRGAAVFSGDNSTGTNAFGTSTGLLLSTASDNSAARITAVSNGANNRNLELRTLASGSAVTAMTLDSSGNVGIGTTSPGELLTLSNATPVLRFVDSDTSREAQIVSIDGNLRFDADNANAQASTNIAFRTDGTERVRIDSSGDVGIGTSTATYRLTVEDSSADWASRIYNTGTGASNQGLLVRTDSTAVNNASAFAVYAGSAYRLMVKSGGNVGIGTSSPSYILDVTGASANVGKFKRDGAGTTEVLIDTSGSGDAQLVFADNGTDSWAIGRDNTNGDFVISASGALGTSNAINIESGGNVGIGTTAPDRKLHVFEGDSTITPNSNGHLVVENSGVSFINILGGNGSVKGILMSGNSVNADGRLTYDDNSRNLEFWTASSERMRIDSSGNVGIGIASLSTRKLAVKSPGVNSAQICLIDASSSNEVWQVGQQADGDGFMSLRTDSGSGTVLFDASGDNYITSGDLAVGNSTPLNKLSVHATATGGYVKDTDTTWNGITIRQTLSNAASAAGLKFETTSTTQNGVAAIVAERVTTNKANLNFLVSDDNGTTYTEALILDGSGIAIFNGPIRNADGSTSAPSYTFSNDTDTGISRPSDNTLAFSTTSDERMRITSGGNVGIGTTSPGTTLECAGSITANPASGANILFENGSGAAVGRVTFDSTNLKVRGDSGKGLKLGSNGSDVITIDTSGNVGIGTAPVSSSRFSVDEDSGNIYAQQLINSNATNPFGLNINFNAGSPDNNTEQFLSCRDSTTARCLIYSDGDLANHDGTYGTISDRHYKTDIQDARSYWNDWKDIQFHTFTKGGKKQFGVIADELETVFPSLVHTSPDENHPNGESQWVDTMNLLQIAGKVIQELQEKNEALEARITALEA